MVCQAAPSAPSSGGAISNAELARLSGAELVAQAAETSRQLAALAGRFMALTAEMDRREEWRSEGATSLETWMIERCGLSPSSARTYAQVGARLFDLPHLNGALAEGALSLDKVKVLVETAEPESDAAVTETARHCSVRELAELARTRRPPTAADALRTHDIRSVRFNDSCLTMTARLGPEAYAEVRSCLESCVRQDQRSVPRDDAAGMIRLDQRLADALVALLRSGAGGSRSSVPVSPHLVVAHVPLEALSEDSDLFGELAHGGLISGDVVRRLACDASVIVALDDEFGHTVYEGRARRDPTPTQRREIMRRDRHCRFPGCANAIFTNAHHIKPWTPRGPTDIENLALLCLHHHARIHAREWIMRGNANGELTFVGPTGRLMTSRPSPLWTRVSTQPGRGLPGDPREAEG